MQDVRGLCVPRVGGRLLQPHLLLLCKYFHLFLNSLLLPSQGGRDSCRRVGNEPDFQAGKPGRRCGKLTVSYWYVRRSVIWGLGEERDLNFQLRCSHLSYSSVRLGSICRLCLNTKSGKLDALMLPLLSGALCLDQRELAMRLSQRELNLVKYPPESLIW